MIAASLSDNPPLLDRRWRTPADSDQPVHADRPRPCACRSAFGKKRPTANALLTTAVDRWRRPWTPECPDAASDLLRRTVVDSYGSGNHSEKRTVDGRADTATVPAKGRGLSQVSHGLDGRDGTMTSIPDAQQDAGLRFWIVEHWPDGPHFSTDLKAGGLSPALQCSGSGLCCRR
jgi:hypothetical protein